MSVPKRNPEILNYPQQAEDTDYINVLNPLDEMDPDYFSYQSDHLAADSFQNLSKSDYAKVIFCDLYYNSDSTVGCRFQITDNVHEDPCDYIGLFRVGYDNLSQCLASKLLSQTDCEDDGKLLRCTFKPSELPELDNGFYQFLYVTRDSEVCGASMPFHIKNSMPKDFNSDEDVVADNTEDDFLVVRSHMAEKNRHLQDLLDEMTEKCLTHECEMRKIQEKLKIVNEEKIKIEQLLKSALEEKFELCNKVLIATKEKNIVCEEKEEAIRILKEKNKAFSSMFDNYSDKLREFTELKDSLLTDKKRALAENAKLQEQIKKLSDDLKNKESSLKEKNQELASSWRKESSILSSQLDDAKLMIEALEKSKQLSLEELTSLNEEVAKLQEKLKVVKCENLVLKTQLIESAIAQEKNKEQMNNMNSEIAALKLHIIEMHEYESSTPQVASGSSSKYSQKIHGIPEALKIPKRTKHEKSVIAILENLPQQIELQRQSTSSEQKVEEFHDLKIQQRNEVSKGLKTHMKNDAYDDKMRIKEYYDLKHLCQELQNQLRVKDKFLAEKDATISELREELTKANGVVEYLTKEKESVQKNGSVLQDALNESILRLNEGSELYKMQFCKIEKLKKKLKKSKADLMEKQSASSMKDSCSSVAESADEASTSVLQLPQNQNSDSDTGEHVVRHSDIYKKASIQLQNMKVSAIDISPTAAVGIESSSKIREVPELQTLIEMNLEKFKNSQSKDDEVLYSIPCPVCDQDIGVYMSSAEEMVKHLEVQHKQQVCPVCGRCFDMSLPAKYFVFHVEDHFVKEE